MAGCSIISKTIHHMSTGRLLTNRVNVNLVLVAGISKKTEELLKSLNIPEKPKKPISAYIRFMMDHRPTVVAKHPNLEMTKVAKIIGEDWNKAHSTIKEKYLDQYKAEQAEYETKLLKYMNSLTPEMKRALELQKFEEREEKEIKKIKQLKKDTNMPKAAPSAYNLFMKDYCDREKVSLNKVPKGLWENLPASEKDKYKQLAESEKQKYLVAYRKWEEQVLEKGLDHLIAKKNLKRKSPILKKKKE